MHSIMCTLFIQYPPIFFVLWFVAVGFDSILKNFGDIIIINEGMRNRILEKKLSDTVIRIIYFYAF